MLDVLVIVLFLGVWATMGVLGFVPVACGYWEDGARILPVLKKRGERSVGAVMAPMCFSDLGFGMAASADVGEGDLFGVFILMGPGLFARCVTGVEANTNIVVLHVGGWDPIDALAGGLLLGIAATAAIAGARASAVALAGGARSVDEVSVRLLLLYEVTTYTF